MAIINAKSSYLNPYEEKYNRLKNSSFFNDDMWKEMSKTGQLSRYVTDLEGLDTAGITDDYMEDTYEWSRLSSQNQIVAIENELYGDREKQTERFETVYDNLGNAQQTSIGVMSDYDYTKKLLEENIKYLNYQESLAAKQEAKNNMNVMEHIFHNVTALAGNILEGAFSIVDGLTDSIGNTIDWIFGDQDAFRDDEQFALFENLGYYDALAQYESDFSIYRDVDGTETFWGKYVGGVATQIGMMLPSIAVNLATGGAGGAVAKFGSVASQVMYYGGMGSNTFREMCYSPEYDSVPTWQLAVNAGVRSAVEYAIERGLTKLTGVSAVDKYVFGMTSAKPNSKLLTIKSWLKEAGSESLEEVAQEISNWVVNAGFSVINESFGKNNELTLQSLADAAIIAFLSTTVMTGMDFVSTKRVDTGVYEVDEKTGQIKLDKQGNKVTKKLGKFESYIYKSNLSDFMSHINEITKSKKDMSAEQFAEVMGQAYASFRVVSSFYGEIGEARAQAADKFLREIKRQGEKGKFDFEKSKKKAEKLVIGLLVDKIKYAVKQNKVIEEMAKAGISTVVKTIERGSDESIFTDKEKETLAPEISKIFQECASISKINITEDGSRPVIVEDEAFIPFNYLSETGHADFSKFVIEHSIVKEVLYSDIMRDSVNDLLKIYDIIFSSDGLTNEEIMFNIIFDTKTFKMMLKITNVKTLQFLSKINNIIDAYLEELPEISADIFRKRWNSVVKQHQQSLIEFLIIADTVNMSDMSLLNKEHVDFIMAKRYSRDLYNRIVINNEVPTEDDIRLIEEKIKLLPADTYDSTAKTYFDKKEYGKALSALSRYYALNTYYDNVTYLKENSVSEKWFNLFLRANNLTAKEFSEIYDGTKLPEAIEKKVKEQYTSVNLVTVQLYLKLEFRNFTNGQYDVSKRNDTFYFTTDVKPSNKYYTVHQTTEIENYNYPETNVDYVKTLDKLTDKALTNAERKYLTISDLLLNHYLLSKQLKDKIKEKYGEITPQSIYDAINEELLKDYKCLNMDANGNIVILNLRPVSELMTDYAKNKGYMKRLVDKETIYLHELFNIPKDSPLYECKVRDDRNLVGNGVYKYKSNEIVLNVANIFDNYDIQNGVNAVLTHEFIHAIQYVNNLSPGFSPGVLLRYKEFPQIKKLLDDASEYLHGEDDEFFEFFEFDEGYTETDMYVDLAYEVYQSVSGEINARGQNSLSMAPFFVKDRYTIVAPWGITYTIPRNAYIASPKQAVSSLQPLEQMSTSLTDVVNKTQQGETVNDKATEEFLEKLRSDKAKERKAKAEATKKEGKESKNKTTVKKTVTKKKTKRVAISKKRAADTNLKYFVNTSYTQYMSPEMEQFVISLDKDDDPILWKRVVGDGRKIKQGSLTQQQVFEYIRKTDYISDRTFKKLKDAFFPYSPFKTYADLEKFVSNEYTELSYYWALNSILQDLGLEELRLDPSIAERLPSIVSAIMKNPSLSKRFVNTASRFTEGKSKLAKQIDKRYTKYVLLKFFTGSIESAGHAARLVRETMFSNWFQDTDSLVEGKRGIAKNKKGEEVETGEDDSTYNDAWGDPEKALEDLNDEAFLEGVSPSTMRRKVALHYGLVKLSKHTKAVNNAIKDGTINKDRKIYITVGEQKYYVGNVVNGKYIPRKIEDLSDFFASYLKQANKLNRDALTDEYLKIVKTEYLNELKVKLAEQLETTEEDADEYLTDDFLKKRNERATKNVKRRRDAVTMVKYWGTMIKKGLNDTEYKNFLKIYPDLFDDDGKLKTSLYVGKTEEEITSLEEKLRDIAKDVRAGAFETLEQHKQWTRLKRENERLKKTLSNEIKRTKNGKQQTIKLSTSDTTFYANSDVEMPKPLKQMLDTSFTGLTDATTKYLSEEGEKNIRMSMDQFFKLNAELLSNMTQEDVDEILNYYSTKIEFTGLTGQEVRKYNSVKIYLLTYLLEQRRLGTWYISEEQTKQIEETLKLTVSNAATELQVWRNVMHKLNPAKTIMASVARSSGIEFEEKDVEKLINLTMKVDSTGKPLQTEEHAKAIKEQIDYMTKYAYEKYTGTKRNFWDSLWKWQRVAMLSSPGTWVRNIVSNHMLTKLNKLSDVIGSALASKKHVEGQYIITGIKASEESKKFTQKEFIDNGLFEMISDGLSKYDTRPLERMSESAKKSKEKIDEQVTKAKQKVYDAKEHLDKVKRKIPPEHLDTLKWKLSRLNDELSKMSDKLEIIAQKKLIAEMEVKIKQTEDAINSYESKVKDAEQRLHKAEQNLLIISNNGEMSEVLSKMILKSITSRVTFDNQFYSTGKGASKAVADIANKFSNFIGKMLSDDKFIKNRTIELFNILLTETGADITSGLTPETMNLFVEAFTQASYEYMHKTNFFNKLENLIRDKFSPAAYYVWKQFSPFMASGFNWFMENLNYTPIGLIKGITKLVRLEKNIMDAENKRQKGEEIQAPIKFMEYVAKQEIGKGVIGTALMALGAALAAFGWVRIDDEDDLPKIVVGDFAIDISDIHGASGLVAGMYFVSSLTKSDNFNSDTFWKCTIATFDQMFGEFAFVELVNTFRYNNWSLGETLVDELSNGISSYIPNMFKTLISTFNNYELKYDRGLMGYFERMLATVYPWAAPREVDPYTGEVQTKYKNYFASVLLQGISKFSPVKISNISVSDIEKEAIYLGVNKGMLTGRYDDIGHLKMDKVQALNEFYGKLNDNDLTELLNDSIKYKVQLEDGKYETLYYSRMSNKQKKSVIERIMSNNAKYAKIYIYTSNGGKYYASNSEYSELLRLGLTENVFKSTKDLKGFK